MLEKFKNSIPQRFATCMSEQKATTVLKAAELADDKGHSVNVVT